MTLDLVLQGGTVVDGTGAPPRRADVAVAGDRIAAVDVLGPVESAEVIDVSGRVVAPGFIDVHAHSDLAGLMSDEHLDPKAAGIRQGVTTEVCGNCGSSPFPVLEPRDDPYLGLFPREARRLFPSLAAYREALAEEPLLSNLAPLLGHGTVRGTVVGLDDRAPTADEVEAMRALVADAMDQGAFGLSTGLIYAPGVFADTDELVALAEVVASHGRPYTTHMRDEGDRLLEAVDEALEIGRRSGASVQISHHKAAGRANWGKTERTLERITAARQGGADVALDVYPYTAGSTLLFALLPPWVLDGGPSSALGYLKDPAARDRIAREYLDGLPQWQNLVQMAGWDNVVIAGDPPYAGRSIAEIAADHGREPFSAMADLLLEDPATVVILHMMDPDEVAAIADTEFALIGSDGLPLPGMQHPRLAGTFARLLGAAKGDLRALADRVHRMTGLSAERFAIPDRGVVAVGKVADLVVFDPTTVTDNATYEEPLLPPAGVDHVLIAGRFAIRDGTLTPTRAGRVLEPA